MTRIARWFLLLPIGLVFLCRPANAHDGPHADPPEASTPEAKRELLLRRTFASDPDEKFTFHKLGYAIVGANDLKLQYSFKYKMIEGADLYVAFTNYILWDIYEDGMPAYDNNFNPEAFYRFLPKESWLFSVDAGYWHLSNGRSGPTSRSWDRLFVRGNKVIRAGYMDIAAVAEIFPVTLQEGRYTQDIASYLGWWNAYLWFRNLLNEANGEGLSLQLATFSGRHGVPFDRGNFTIGGQYRAPRWTRFNPILYVQYFNGYGEVIQDYYVFRDEFRMGLSWHY